MFSLRFASTEIPQWASRYPAEDDHQVEMVIVPQEIGVADNISLEDSAQPAVGGE